MPTLPVTDMLLLWIGTGLNMAAAGYACVSLWAWFRCRHAQARQRTDRAIHPVSVFKPLHGAEPRLYENLRSFCLQDHTNYQLLFGVREADDPAIAVVERLIAEFPALSIRLVVDPRIHGANLKVSNLINLVPHAEHDWLVLADSDISVARIICRG